MSRDKNKMLTIGRGDELKESGIGLEERGEIIVLKMGSLALQSECLYCQPFCLWGTAGTGNECEEEKEASRHRVGGKKLMLPWEACAILKNKRR